SCAKHDSVFHRAGKRERHSWCKECYNARARQIRNRKITPEQRAAHNLWRRYRLRPEQAEAMLREQGGVCAICSTPPERPVVDHCHTTRTVRGILCHGCNLKLAAVENQTFLRSALSYLGVD